MGNNKFKILIVEDEANIRSFIKANPETSDYQVLCAETCALGMMMYTSHHPDLIILDLGLPDRDGMSLIQEVRKTDTVPIIVLSARSSERDKVEALDLGGERLYHQALWHGGIAGSYTRRSPQPSAQ